MEAARASGRYDHVATFWVRSQLSFYDRTMRELHCKGCGERTQMYTRQIFNPEQFVQAVERFAQEHGRCELFKNPRKARAALMYGRLTSLLDGVKKGKARFRHGHA